MPLPNNRKSGFTRLRRRIFAHTLEKTAFDSPRLFSEKTMNMHVDNEITIACRTFIKIGSGNYIEAAKLFSPYVAINYNACT